MPHLEGDISHLMIPEPEDGFEPGDAVPSTHNDRVVAAAVLGVSGVATAALWPWLGVEWVAGLLVATHIPAAGIAAVGAWRHRLPRSAAWLVTALLAPWAWILVDLTVRMIVSATQVPTDWLWLAALGATVMVIPGLVAAYIPWSVAWRFTREDRWLAARASVEAPGA